jgi:hypothetical protein
MGLFGLGPFQTLAVLAAVTAVLIAGSVRPATLVVAGPVAAVLLVLNLAKWDGVPIMAGVRERTRFLVGSRRGRTAYRSGPAGDDHRTLSLPGVLASTALVEVHDRAGGSYALVHNRALAEMTATFRCASASTWLADPETANTWVASWGGWLAGLGYQPMIRHIAVTVDTAPDQGTKLADYWTRRGIPDAPASALRVLNQLVEQAPAAAADVETRVSITFYPAASPARPRTIPEAVDEVARALPGLQDGLGLCGVAVLGRASAQYLAGTLRAAFDPAVRGEVARALNDAGSARSATDLPDWPHAGPVSADEYRDRYVHDSGVSVSWAMHEAPRQQVHADVLARLLAPGRYPKRVTLLYRPLSAGAAARVVENEVNAAAFRSAYSRAQRRDESARDAADRERAMQAAREEAQGAGVALLSLFVTVTVTDPDELSKAIADVESRADTAKIRLRRLWSSQAAGFAATLPAGVCPPTLARQWPR